MKPTQQAQQDFATAIQMIDAIKKIKHENETAHNYIAFATHAIYSAFESKYYTCKENTDLVKKLKQYY